MINFNTPHEDNDTEEQETSGEEKPSYHAYSKKDLKRAYIRGMKDGKGIESFSDKEVRTMDFGFEIWFSVNFGGGDE